MTLVLKKLFSLKKKPIKCNLNISGSSTLLITNPVWIAKTRLCLQYENQSAAYRGMFHAISDVYRTHGIRGLYKVNIGNQL